MEARKQDSNNFIGVVKNQNKHATHYANVSLYLHLNVVYAISEGVICIQTLCMHSVKAMASLPMGRLTRTIAEVRKSCALAHDDLDAINILINDHFQGAQWLSGRVLDLRMRGCRFEPH